MMLKSPQEKNYQCNSQNKLEYFRANHIFFKSISRDNFSPGGNSASNDIIISLLDNVCSKAGKTTKNELYR